jgi:hypothetical protein
MGDRDIGWKESLENYLEQAMALLFPGAHAQIDWSRPYEFLDKELQQVMREGESGTRLVDKLVKVWLKNGEERWVLIHIEVQGEAETDFGLRMYVYNFRIFDRYGREVASFAILADDRSDWRPDRFGYNLLGCSIDFRFPTVKLLDFVGREAELEANANPFAIVVLAYLRARQTVHDDNQRRMSKIRLIRSLYERGLERNDVVRLFGLIDWFMALPKEMERDVWHEVERIEKEMQMPRMTSIERIWLEDGEAKGLAKGLAEGRAEGRAEARAEARASLETGIETLLEVKFGESVAGTFMADVRRLEPSQLLDCMRLIKVASSPDDLRQNFLELAKPSGK